MAIYNIDKYMNLREHSTLEPIATIIQFPKDSVNWKNYFEQKENDNADAIEKIKVEGEIKAMQRKTSPIFVPGPAPSIEQLNYENSFLGF